jgi:alkylhydroperoxidase/carboxymuconolactone decarboxylase family protein YurZ
MARKSPLDDSATSAHAWARYRRIMGYLGLMTLGIIAIAFAVVYRSGEPVSVHFYIALALGFGFTVMLTGALMGLIFLSSGTGHDESVEDPSDRDSTRPKRRERGPFG